ncbi:hypothetical protein YC2023_101804 [Brassica napus]
MTIYLKSVLDLLSLKCCVFDLAYVIASNLNRKSEVLSVSGLVDSRTRLQTRPLEKCGRKVRKQHCWWTEESNAAIGQMWEESKKSTLLVDRRDL